MSAGAAAVADAPAHAGPGRVIGTLVVLAVFAACAAWIAQSLLVSGLDGVEKQREYFGDGGPPLGLALESAVRLPTGDAVLRFARAEGGAPENAPAEVLLVEYRSRAAVGPLFRGAPGGEGGPPGERIREWERDPSFAWKATVRRGDVDFGPWTAKLVVERSFREGGGWSEEARVDLSSRERALVAFVRFPDGVTHDERVLRELLSAVDIPADAAPGAR